MNSGFLQSAGQAIQSECVIGQLDIPSYILEANRLHLIKISDNSCNQNKLLTCTFNC
jgi:hypothetical protein